MDEATGTTATTTDATTSTKPASDADFVSRMMAKAGTAATPSPAAKSEPPDDDELEPPADDADSTDDADSDSDETPSGDASQDDTDEAEFQAAFTAAMKAEGVSVSLDDLPAEARPIVEKRLADLQKGFTKATTKLRTEVAELHELRADRIARDENYVAHAAAHFIEHPELIEEINAEVERITNAGPKGLDYHKRDLADAKTAAAKKVTEAAEVARRAEERGTVIERTARAAAQASNVPFTRGMQVELKQARADNGGDLTRAQIQTIVREHAKELRTVQRADRRDASAAAVQAQVSTARKAGLPVSPRAGNSPQPGAQPKPKNDAEFAESFANRMASTTRT